MKKLVLSVLAFVIVQVIIPDSVFAFEPFIKDPNNPLRITSLYPNWQEVGQFQPSVIVDGSSLKMWYASYDGNHFKIAYVTSADGLNWSGNTLSSFNDAFDNHDPSIVKSDPSIIKTGTGYTLFFASSQGGGNYKISKISSQDGVTFDESTLKTILSPTGPWESTGISAPYVLFKNGTYYLVYSGRDASGRWNVGLATSADSDNWSRCTNNPLITDADAPSIFEENGNTYIFFHSPEGNGLEQATTSDILSCNSNWLDRHYILQKGPQPYDALHMTSPSVIRNGNFLNLYYSGLGSDGKWRLNLATSSSTAPKKPIVIVPGLFSSWNKAAMIHNQTVPYTDWQLLPFVKEYSGLTSTLKNLNLQENLDYFVFPYDFRKSVENTSDDLKSFLDAKIFLNNPSQKVDIVGHSLGGLVGRIFAQKYHDKVDKIITAGTPHKGTPLVYKPLSAGEIDRENTYLWLAQKLILTVNKNPLQSDREIIQKLFPVAYDLLPTFDFLKKSDGSFIKTDSLFLKNPTLPVYNLTFANIYDVFTALYGQTDINAALNGYIVTPANPIDLTFGNYKDGHPITPFFGQGDNTVLSTSAKEDNDPDSFAFNMDHGEIIYKKDAISKILSLLNIAYSQDKITEGQGTIINPSLIFLIQSPAAMEVLGPDNLSYAEFNGIIFIPNAASGNYLLKVKGTDLGKYTVYVGQIAKNNDVWDKIDGEIKIPPPISQTDLYLISFNNVNASTIFPSPTPQQPPTITPLLPPPLPPLSPTPTSVPTPTTASFSPSVTQVPTPTITLSPSVTPTSTPTPTPTISLSSPTQVPTSTVTPIPTVILTSNQNYSPNINLAISIPPQPTAIIQEKTYFAQNTQPQVLGTTSEKQIACNEVPPQTIPTNLANNQPFNLNYLILSIQSTLGFVTLGYLIKKNKS